MEARPGLTVVHALKCLAAGSISPFTGFRWPAPRNGAEGDWVEAVGELSMCRNGIHAIRLNVLPSWLDDELWQVELDGVELEREGVLVARRGRLLERVASWNEETAHDLAAWCAARAREFAESRGDERLRRMAAELQGAVDSPNTVGVALVAFGAAEIAVEADQGGAAEERRRQSEWLLERLSLPGPL